MMWKGEGKREKRAWLLVKHQIGQDAYVIVGPNKDLYEENRKKNGTI